VSWSERRQAEAAELGRSRQPYVVVLGGGQGGIALGARLRQLGDETRSHRARRAASRRISVSNRTCEFGLTRATGRPYRSIVHLLEEATRAMELPLPVLQGRGQRVV